MRKHTKVYMDYFSYGLGDFIPCEITGERAVDIHHIEARGSGGTKKEDTIENLMAITRELHVAYGDKTYFKEGLKIIHKSFMENQTPWLQLNDKLPWD